MPSPSVLDVFRRLLAEGEPAVNGRHPELDTWPNGYAGWSVAHYCREEVRRQGHDLAVYEDGGARVEWMMRAWTSARRWRARCRWPTETYIVRLARLVEPEKNLEGLRTCHVRVGSRLCPPPSEVPELLRALILKAPTLPPLEWYRDFQLTHPFRDGNGRTGKILLSWLADAEHRTLSCPRFPPDDLFGAPIINP